MTHVGIDVSKKVLDTAALDDNGEVIRARFKNTTTGREGCLELSRNRNNGTWAVQAVREPWFRRLLSLD